jgi:hypothetical protein
MKNKRDKEVSKAYIGLFLIPAAIFILLLMKASGKI